MHINMKNFPPDTIQQYNIHEKVARDGFVYIKTFKNKVWFETSCSINNQQLSTKYYSS